MIATQKKTRNSGVSILNRILELDGVPIPPDAARTFLSLRFPKADERRMNRLAEKARAGTLTDHDQSEAEQYNLVSHFVAFLHAKAEQALK